jgi:hypothetical protein
MFLDYRAKGEEALVLLPVRSFALSQVTSEASTEKNINKDIMKSVELENIAYGFVSTVGSGLSDDICSP